MSLGASPHRGQQNLTAICTGFAFGLLVAPLLELSTTALKCAQVCALSLLPLSLLGVVLLRQRLMGLSACLLLGALLAGFSLQSLQLQRRVAMQLPQALEGSDIGLVVQVENLPEARQSAPGRYSTIFYARVLSVNDLSHSQRGLLNRRLRLSWYSQAQPVSLQPGQRWQLTVRLKRPRGMVNPGGFDYQAWLLARDVVATGYVRSRNTIAMLDVDTGLSFDKLRYRLNQQLFSSPLQHKALFRALLIGDKSAISQQQWQVLRATGTVHLMAISGLHIGLVASAFFFLGAGLARLISLFQPQGIRWLAPACSVLAACCYAGMAGFAIPTQRALVMVVLFNLAIWQGRTGQYWHLFVLAVVAVLLLEPFAPLSAGFWLSFAAVAILVLALSNRSGTRSRVGALIKAQLVLLLGLLVPLTLLDLPVAGLGPVANLVAVPVVSVVVVPGLFIAAFLSLFSTEMALTVLGLLAQAFEGLWNYLQWLSTTDWLWHSYSYPQSTPGSLLYMLLAGLAVVLMLLPRGLAVWPAGLALMLCFAYPRSPPAPGFRITALDVQQGLALVLQAGEYTLVYDTGARYSEDFDMGERVILPFLRRQGIQTVDTLVVSHSDNDHAGGAQSLLSALNVRQLIAGQPVQSGLEDAVQCVAGQHWRAGATSFEFLWPTAEALQQGGKDNNQSCILRITQGDIELLLMGDVERSVERRLLAMQAMPEDIDLLVVPHHGSQSSSSTALVDHLNPDFALFSVGYRNRYKHPSQQVLARYQKRSEILRTDVHGAIVLDWPEAAQPKLTRQRFDAPRPWYSGPPSTDGKCAD